MNPFFKIIEQRINNLFTSGQTDVTMTDVNDTENNQFTDANDANEDNENLQTLFPTTEDDINMDDNNITEPLILTPNTDNNIINEDNTNNIVNGETKDAIIYCRVSTKKQEMDAQVNSCLQYARLYGFNILKTIKEFVSAYKSTKQNKLMDTIKSNKNITLIIYSVDRFSRNIQNCNIFINLLEQNNITLKCVKEQINLKTAYGKHNFRSIVSMAQYESELIGERVKNNIKYKKQHNIPRVAPYGSMIDKENKVIVKNDDEQAIIKFILNNVNRRKRVCDINQHLYTLMEYLKKPNDHFVPITFTDEDEHYEYTKYEMNEPILITKSILVEILNDYNIYKRNRQWTVNSIHSVIKINASIDIVIGDLRI